MKPQRFEIGQAITRKRMPWFSRTTTCLPKQGEIYHVSSYVHPDDIKRFGTPFSCWYITVFEHGSKVWHCEKDFEPVISDTELETLLNSVPETIETV